MTPSEQLIERVERLLLRVTELKRANDLLQVEVLELRHDKQQLKNRLDMARQRVDKLLQRLPEGGVSDATRPEA